MCVRACVCACVCVCACCALCAVCCMYVHKTMCTNTCTYVCMYVCACVVGISSEQFAVMEQKLEKSWATEKALHAEVTMWKTELQEVRIFPYLFHHRPLPQYISECLYNGGTKHTFAHMCTYVRVYVSVPIPLMLVLVERWCALCVTHVCTYVCTCCVAPSLLVCPCCCS